MKNVSTNSVYTQPGFVYNRSLFTYSSFNFITTTVAFVDKVLRRKLRLLTLNTSKIKSITLVPVKK